MKLDCLNCGRSFVKGLEGDWKHSWRDGYSGWCSAKCLCEYENITGEARRKIEEAEERQRQRVAKLLGTASNDP